eukprot:g6170.t1
MDTGEVTASSSDGQGEGMLEVLFAGRFSHRLQGIHRGGVWERFRLARPNQMQLQHWQRADGDQDSRG